MSIAISVAASQRTSPWTRPKPESIYWVKVPRNRSMTPVPPMSVEHLRGAGLVARPVIEEIGELLLRLLLVLDCARAFQALSPSDRHHDAGQVGQLFGQQRDQLVAGLRRLERPGRRLAR